MHRDSSPRLVGGRRLPLRLEVLEDRTQPNDLLGLGLSTLSGMHLWDFGTTETSQLARTVTSSDPEAALPAVVQAAATPAFELRDTEDPEDASAPLVPSANGTATPQGIDQAFTSVNAQAPAALGQQRDLNRILAQTQVSLRAAGLQVGAFHTKGTPSQGGATSAGPSPFVTIQSGTVSVGIDSFNRAGEGLEPGVGYGVGIGTGFEVDGVGNIFEGQDYFGMATGPVTAINATNCSILAPVTLLDPTTSLSVVLCGERPFVFVNIAVDGLGWISVTVDVGETAANCYYSYADYDVNGFLNNGSSYQAAVPQFVIRNNVIEPNQHFHYQDLSTSTHWQQGIFDGLRSTLNGAQNCANLTDTPAQLTGDVTMAYQWADTGTIVRLHARMDGSAYP